MQIVAGVMLLLFGFYEIMSYARGRERSTGEQPKAPAKTGQPRDGKSAGRR